MAGEYNFRVEKGEDMPHSITIYTDSTKTTPEDLTGFTADMTIRTKRGDLVAHFDSATELSLGDAAGTIGFNVSAATIDTYPTGEHVYQLRTISGGGVTRKRLKGKFSVLEGIKAGS